MKISGSFFTMLLIWVLGFTHFLGGPYLLFRIIFWIAILPVLIRVFILLLVLLKAKKILNTSNKYTENKQTGQETIHIEATIKE